MKFHIMSRTKAKNYFFQALDHDCAVISITDAGSEPVRFPRNEHIRAILSLSFDDVDAEEAKAISTQDADKIVSFVSHMRDTVEEIVVHCEAGVSRSAGVCAALMLWLNGTDQPIFNNPYYRPNMRCYRFVLNRIIALNNERADRFDRKIRVAPPRGDDAEKIIAYYLKCKKFVGSIDVKTIARIMDGISYAELETVINEAGMSSLQTERASGLSRDEFRMVWAYTRYLEICHPVQDGKVQKQEKPMSYKEFKENFKIGR